MYLYMYQAKQQKGGKKLSQVHCFDFNKLWLRGGLYFLW